jgi:hypothetical protein
MNEYLKQLEDNRTRWEAAKHNAAEEWKAINKCWGEIEAAMCGPLSIPNFHAAAKQVAATLPSGRAEAVRDSWGSGGAPVDRARLSCSTSCYLRRLATLQSTSKRQLNSGRTLKT